MKLCISSGGMREEVCDYLGSPAEEMTIAY